MLDSGADSAPIHAAVLDLLVTDPVVDPLATRRALRQDTPPVLRTKRLNMVSPVNTSFP